jgi:hypothetical protein
MTEDEAKKRFLILNLVRLFALATVLVGVLNISGRLLPDLAPTLGYALFVFGAADFFLAPVLLKKMWRERDG